MKVISGQRVTFKALGIFGKTNRMKKYFLVTVSSYLSEPYKIISNSNSSFKFLKKDLS